MASKKSKTGAIERYNAGVVFYNKKDYTKAISEFRGALSADSKNVRYRTALANSYNNRGVSRYEAKKYEMAASDFEKAAGLESNNNQYAENLKLAKDSMKKDKMDGLCKGAYASYNKKKYTESIKMLKETAKLSPKDRDLIEALAVAYNGRGVKHYEEGKFEKAIDDFSRAKQLWPAEEQYGKNLQWTKVAARRSKKKKK
ncbi:MAG: tetratricopeptide repeat protein [Candidatus Micrarchaeota archaeon]